MTDDKQITIALDERQEKALGLMLNGRKDKEITEELGISRQTLYRWRKYDANFLQILEERRNMLREQVEDGLLELTDAALEAIRSALTEGDTRTRLQAARLVLGILDVGSKGKDAKKDSGIFDLLAEAMEGIEDELGLSQFKK